MSPLILSSKDEKNLTGRLSTVHKSKNFLVFILIINKSLIRTLKLLVKRWRKSNALARVIKYMYTSQVQMRSFIMSKYFHSRGSNFLIFLTLFPAHFDQSLQKIIFSFQIFNFFAFYDLLQIWNNVR